MIKHDEAGSGRYVSIGQWGNWIFQYIASYWLMCHTKCS